MGALAFLCRSLAATIKSREVQHIAKILYHNQEIQEKMDLINHLNNTLGALMEMQDTTIPEGFEANNGCIQATIPWRGGCNYLVK